MYSIYKHTNLETGKVYIGMTSRPVEQRWGNGHNYKDNVEFNNDIHMYGWMNFSHEVICTCQTYEEACKLEKFYINENIDNCYNKINAKKQTPPSTVPSTVSCTEPSTVPSTEHPAQNQYHWHISPVNIPIVPKPANRHSCPVSQYSLSGELLNVFQSAKIASQETGINHGSIISCCKGKRATGKSQKGAGGYIWRYNVDHLDDFPETPPASKKINKLDRNQKVISTYDSISDAALENKVPYSGLVYVLSKRCLPRFAYGYYWEYAK